MASSSSSAASPHQHHLHYSSLYSHPHGPTSAPPPTPSSLHSDDSNNLLPRSSDQDGAPAADTLSRLLQRQLTPNLSLPSRFRSSTTNTTTPNASDVEASVPATFSLSSLNSENNNIMNKLLAESACELGFFLLSTDHGISSELGKSSESDSTSLFSLPHERKRELFSLISNWPVGFHDDDEDELPDEDEKNNRQRTGSSFCLDKMTIRSISSGAADQPPVKLSCLEEMTVELERVGMEVIGKIFTALGLIGEEGKKGLAAVVGKLCSLMWVSEYDDESGSESEQVEVGRHNNNNHKYPYVVALEYQVCSGRKYCLETDSGLALVAPPVESVLVMLGDIAQVWTNGKTKKVRGRPIPAINNNNNNTANYHDDVSSSATTSKLLTMTLLITLPLESTVSPKTLNNNIYGEDQMSSRSAVDVEEEEEEEDNDVVECGRVFRSFSFEDYCWRVYHDNQRRLMSYKDPLDRYRIHPED